MFLSVGMTGFEPATTRPPDAYSNRTELHPVTFCLFASAKILLFWQYATIFQKKLLHFLILLQIAP